MVGDAVDGLELAGQVDAAGGDRDTADAEQTGTPPMTASGGGGGRSIGSDRLRLSRIWNDSTCRPHRPVYERL